MKNYLFEQKSGNSTRLVILQNPVVKEGTVYGTMVGAFAGWEENHEEIYRECDPVEFIAGGGPWSMREYKKELSKRKDETND